MVSSFESALSRLVMKGKKSQIQGLPWWLGAAVAISLAVLTGLMYMSMDRPSTKNEPAKIQPTNGKEADPLQEAKLIFALSCDPDSCKRALQILGRLPKTSTYPLVSQEIEGLTPQDDDYLNSATFPPADAWYWAEQLLLKKIIDGNEMAESPGRQTALAQAEILWFWTMRMVRLSELSFEFPEVKGISSLSQVIRRGTGTAEERGLIFLELLNQARPIAKNMFAGALVRTQRATDDPFNLIVAFQIELDGTVFLGDPRTGRLLGTPSSPLPLSELLVNTLWLGQFCGKGESLSEFKLSLNGAKFMIPIPLPALAGRQVDIQNNLFSTNDAPVLFREPKAVIKRLKSALSAQGLTDPSVIIDPNYLVRLLNYLPKTEGGRDDSGLNRQATELSLIPWDSLPSEMVPRTVKLFSQKILQKAKQSQGGPPDIEYLARLVDDQRQGRPKSLGVVVPDLVNSQITLPVFGGIFLEWQSFSGKGRDLLVNGQFGRLVPDLIQEKEDLDKKAVSDGSDIRKELVIWLTKTNEFSRQSLSGPGKEREEEFLKEFLKAPSPFLEYLFGRIATARLPDIQLALAQVRHEQAGMTERKTRSLRLSKLGGDRNRAWQSAALAWGNVAKTHSGKNMAHYARLWQGVALWQAGDFDSAKQVWQFAGEGNSPEQKSAKWLLDFSSR